MQALSTNAVRAILEDSGITKPSRVAVELCAKPTDKIGNATYWELSVLPVEIKEAAEACQEVSPRERTIAFSHALKVRMLDSAQRGRRQKVLQALGHTECNDAVLPPAPKQFLLKLLHKPQKKEVLALIASISGRKSETFVEAKTKNIDEVIEWLSRWLCTGEFWPDEAF